MRTSILVSALFALTSAPVMAADTQVASTAKPDKNDPNRMICRRETPVGSLIASRKTCLTVAQWQTRANDGNDEARKMVYDNQGRPSGN